MLQSYIVYIFLALVMSVCGVIASYRERKMCLVSGGVRRLSFAYPEIIVMILSFAVIFGCRYNVGVDYPHYLDAYLWGSDREFEPLFAFVTETMSKSGIHYAVYFSLWAFTECFLLFYTFKNQRYLFPYIVFFLIFGSYYLSMMNVIRQQLAACIFLYSLHYVDDKNVFKYYFLLLISLLFHKSAIILIIIYPLFQIKKDWFYKYWIQFALLAVAIFLSTQYDLVVKSVSKAFELFVGTLGYGDYAAGILHNEKLNSANQFGNNTGVGIFINIFIDASIIACSKGMKKYYDSSFFDILYSLWFVRIMADFIVGDSIILNRPFVYFYNIKMIILAYFAYYCVKTRRWLPQLLVLIIFMLHIAMFVNMQSNGIINTSRFSFFWQN